MPRELTWPGIPPLEPGDLSAALGLGPKHEHVWRTVGYGGAGWYLLRCDECGAEEIA